MTFKLTYLYCPLTNAAMSRRVLRSSSPTVGDYLKLMSNISLVMIHFNLSRGAFQNQSSMHHFFNNMSNKC